MRGGACGVLASAYGAWPASISATSKGSTVGESAAKRPEIAWRVLFALPAYFLLVVFWMVAVCAGFVGDKIAGKRLSKELTGV